MILSPFALATPVFASNTSAVIPQKTILPVLPVQSPPQTTSVSTSPSALDQLALSLASSSTHITALDKLINSLLTPTTRPVLPPLKSEVKPSFGVLANRISERYSIDPSEAYDIVALAHQEAEVRGVDPVLILSIIATESSLNPTARSRAGAMGLMQVIPKYHQEKLDRLGMSRQDLYNPQQNIRVGTEILSEYIDRSKGNTTSALQRYNGSLSDDSRKYSNKVFRAMTWLSSP